MKFFPVGRVLVPVDLSPVSTAAWAWAKDLSADDARRDVLYVRLTAPAPILGLPTSPLTRRETLELTGRMRRAYPGCRPRVVAGDPTLLISRASRSADLVVMSSHRRKGLDRALLGSVCEAVVRESRAVTLVVPAGPRQVSSILAPTNMTDYSRKGLRLAAEAALFFQAELVFLYAAADPRRAPNPRFFIEDFMESLPGARRRTLKTRLLIRAGRPVDAILKESRRHGIVALTAHRKSLFGDLVLGMTAERVLRHSPIPVLTAPAA